MENSELAVKLGFIRKEIEDALKIGIRYPGVDAYLKQAKLNIELALANLGFPVAEEPHDTCS